MLNQIQLDDVAAFSITESSIANSMTKIIGSALGKLRKDNDERPIVIFDGMACVGGNTISFSRSFARVLANELDHNRYMMLLHNVKNVLGLQNVEFMNGSILDLAFSNEYNVLFLDPEWGGPDYKTKSNLRLTIGDQTVEDFSLQTFQNCPQLELVALKLPTNYDNYFLKEFFTSRGYSYVLYSSFKNMTLTLLHR